MEGARMTDDIDDNAPETDRTAMLEARLGRLSSALETVIQHTAKREQTAEEQRFSEAEARLDGELAKASSEVDRHETALTAAYDDGEGSTIAKAQRALAEAVARRERIATEVDMAKRQLKTAKEKRTAPAGNNVDTSNLEAWKTRHASWYGVDDDMTKAAHEIDREIRNLGVLAPGSKEYFGAIDKRMAQRFPDKLGGSPPGPRMTGGGREDGGGSATRIPQDIAESYSRMGFNMKDPETVKRLIAARETAVDKGLLPQQRTTGRPYIR